MEYVLYEDDFSSDTLSNYTITGNCSVSNGNLVMNAKETADAYVLLPSWLNDFGNYSVTTSVNIKEPKNDSRWISVMYRVQSSSSFFQMAVRQNAAASNGVELAYSAEGQWKYHSKGSYTGALSESSYYTLELDVFGTSATASINGALCASSTAVKELDRGNIGLRTNQCIASYDSIKVTARFPIVSADVRYTSSNITLAPSMIYEITDKASLDGILTSSPTVAVMTVDAKKNILASDGSTICSIAEAIARLDGKVIPAIRAAKDCDTETVADIISALKLIDVFFISDNTADIKAVRSINSSILGIYDMSKKSTANVKLINVRAATLKSGAKICILPASLATQRNTEFLNTLGVTVWYATSANTEVEMFKLVTSGANGILTPNRKLMEDVVTSSIFKKNSIIRPLGVIGHRGTPALAPENTIADSELAAKNGASIIENDIYLTTDGVIVVMHDDKIDRTTNGTGSVESFSLAELRKNMVDAKPTTKETAYGTVTDAQPIPTLEDYFKAFKDTDTFMFIEIKSGKHQAIATALKKLIDEYDIADQCGVIAFKTGAVTAIRNTIPEISVGYLCEDSVLDTIITNTSRLGSSYNPNCSAINAKLVKDLAARGIFTWPWTIRDSASFDKYFLMGVGGITTDNSYLAKNYIKRVFTDKNEFTLNVNSTLDIGLTAETYGAADGANDFSNRTYPAKNAEMIIISGNDSLVYVSGMLKATAAGDYTVLFRQSFKLNNGETAYVYSEPVTVHATASSAEDNGEANADNTTNTPPSSEATTTAPVTTEKKKGCGSSISAGSAVVAVTALTLGWAFKKKED